MLPKRGNSLPQRHLDTEAYARVISRVLRQELGETHRAAKTLMSWTHASERTTKNWLMGTVGPSGPHLIALMRHSEAVFRAVLELTGRDRLLPAASLLGMRSRLADILAQLEALAPRDVEIQVPCAVIQTRRER
jgi:hypothetical protein